jgi:hypothetical protein
MGKGMVSALDCADLGVYYVDNGWGLIGRVEFSKEVMIFGFLVFY